MLVSFFTADLENFIPRLIRVTYKIKYCECEKFILNVGVEYETYLVHNINDVSEGFHLKSWLFLTLKHQTGHRINCFPRNKPGI